MHYVPRAFVLLTLLCAALTGCGSAKHPSQATPSAGEPAPEAPPEKPFFRSDGPDEVRRPFQSRIEESALWQKYINIKKSAGGKRPYLEFVLGISQTGISTGGQSSLSVPITVVVTD